MQIPEMLTLSQVLDDASTFLASLGFGPGDIELVPEEFLEEVRIPADAELMLRFILEGGGLTVRMGLTAESELDAMRLLAVGRVMDFDMDTLGRIAALAHRWRATLCVNARGFALSR